MNDRRFENKVNRDIDRTKRDLATLKDDGVTGVGRIFEQMSDDVKETVEMAAKTFGQAVEQGLSQYNTKIQDVANRVPGGFGKKAGRYPWVAVTMSLFFGLLLGVFLKPGRQPAG